MNRTDDETYRLIRRAALGAVLIGLLLVLVVLVERLPLTRKLLAGVTDSYISGGPAVHGWTTAAERSGYHASAVENLKSVGVRRAEGGYHVARRHSTVLIHTRVSPVELGEVRRNCVRALRANDADLTGILNLQIREDGDSDEAAIFLMGDYGEFPFTHLGWWPPRTPAHRLEYLIPTPRRSGRKPGLVIHDPRHSEIWVFIL